MRRREGLVVGMVKVFEKCTLPLWSRYVWCLVSPWPGRLFPEISLYSEGEQIMVSLFSISFEVIPARFLWFFFDEGHPKPVLRGMLHLFFTMLLPFGLEMLWKVGGHRNNIAHVASTLYICSNLWCYGISALYHVGNWSVQTEILLQKLDHCGVAILSTGTMIPCCLLLLPMHIGLLFMSLSIMCSVRTCYYVLRLEPSVSRQVS